jgi:hypothetical protein
MYNDFASDGTSATALGTSCCFLFLFLVAAAVGFSAVAGAGVSNAPFESQAAITRRVA